MCTYKNYRVTIAIKSQPSDLSQDYKPTPLRQTLISRAIAYNRFAPTNGGNGGVGVGLHPAPTPPIPEIGDRIWLKMPVAIALPVKCRLQLW